MGRPSRNILSPAIIAGSALKLVRLHRDFTIPGIAADLGVNASSLYHHVKGGKAEIIKLMRAELYAGLELSAFHDATIPWQERLAGWMRSYRDASAQVPAVLPLLVGARVDDARTLEVYETLLVILDHAGVPGGQQPAVSAMVDAMVIGSAIDAASPDALWITTPETPLLAALAQEPTSGRRREDGLEFAIRAVVVQVEGLVGA
ncbi:TetR/AcrR family transcriptional regulator C-terminal domain-containing protein [Pseudarthrobacter sp. PS3-L1]|uniref:TetR/AcrR family transcriptional regulator n=1 Tax=Pseudarthrobacter sp. PS3-L1 TaxID=3046207 RepID=UPI0024B9F53C|nr:TetR/AcrR family transcriptional regulator C-terminal domain-containing protein [Pseudarthrobacter sp. PS3-L1]MDJ0319518.1 TetR/AcrR family transcriptional regulator C-terminal domain-containing protein [Pseudarthrobacter sp. PS3-L1]